VNKVQYKQVDLPNGERISYREREGGEKKLLLIHGNMTSSKHALIAENRSIVRINSLVIFVSIKGIIDA